MCGEVHLSGYAVAMELSLDQSGLTQMGAFFKGKAVLVTGGASFIGSHLTDSLVALGSRVTVIDDLSSGRLENIHPEARFIEGDVRDVHLARSACTNQEIVFHLAAVHGGRGFIETQQQQMVANFGIDTSVFTAAVREGVSRVVHASSACAYPITLQALETSGILLREEQVSFNAPDGSFPDGLYGWSKLMGEYQLAHAVQGSKTTGRSARVFTAYGERENESHAAVALIAKGLLKVDPYPIWGSGNQTRNFTYVADTVTGLLLLGADGRDAAFDCFNIGTSEHVRVIDFVQTILDTLDWHPRQFAFELDKPTGVASRAADNTKIFRILGWQPSTPVEVGIMRTLEWYSSLATRPRTVEQLNELLMSR